jgi:elongator complex protein 3
VRAIADVVRTMIDAVRDGKVINLNSTKNEAARRYGLKRSPKLVELIGAGT